MEYNLTTPLRDLLPIMQERIVGNSTYFGIPTQKSPTDFWIYQEIIHQQRPDVIVEIGNLRGGSALALAHLCDNMGHGRVVAVDIDQRNVAEIVRQHPRITLIEGDAQARFETVRAGIKPGERVLVIEDSSHTYENTLGVLRLYSALVPPGGYLIVEDSICHHGLPLGPLPGPYEAIDTFVAEDPRFEIDRSKEGYVVTWNPKGYLRRRV
jgi:cephalosporin hydroxylase